MEYVLSSARPDTDRGGCVTNLQHVQPEFLDQA
jgi:hypothetical protein